MNRKILVCITPQSNSTRLIDRGYAEASQVNGTLHILHVEKGNCLFNTAESPKLLQELFKYGSERNGVIHGLCGEDVQDVIAKFIKSKRITDVIFGAPLTDMPNILNDMCVHIREMSPAINIIVLKREK